MKKLSIVIGACAALLLAGALLLNIPTVQDRLLDRAIAQRLLNSQEQLFADDALRVVICGSAAPMPVEGRAAACVMVIAGGKYYIVDTGNRSTNNLGLWGIPFDRIGGVFLTHFHSDHIGDLGELNMMTWAQGRPEPLSVFGPAGVQQVVDGFSRAYALDSAYRTAHHGTELLNPAKGKMRAIEVPMGDSPALLINALGNGIADQLGALSVTMFNVDHSPIHPAVGYRFDYKGRSVVISGDTIAIDALANHAEDADLLIHEALARPMVKQMEAAAGQLGNARMQHILQDIQDYHASPREAAEIANRANVQELVLYHLVPTPPNRIAERVFMRGVSDIRSNGVSVASDGSIYVLPIGKTTIKSDNLFDR